MADDPTTTAQNTADAVDKSAPAKSTPPKRDPQLSARDALMAKIDEQVEAERAAEHERFLTSSDVDPRAAALAVAMAKEAKGEALDVDRGHRDLTKMGGENEEAEPTDVVDGAASVEKFDPETKPAQRVSHKGEDPLGQYVVRVDGKPMFKTIVDGQERLIPLDRAQAELQKHEAANVRLQQVAEQRKQLAAREAALKAAEGKKTHPSAKPVEIDDLGLARELIRSLESESADKAAAKMADTFKKIRQATGPVVDLNEVRRAAADEARQAVAVEKQREAFSSGWEQFQKDYPDIAKDSNLFALADKRSEAIGEEHPDWSPTQVMIEAGRQTREWLVSMGVKPTAGAAPVKSDPIRQQRKDGLVPMPQPSGAARREAPKAESSEESPAATLAEIRKLRGQPY